MRARVLSDVPALCACVGQVVEGPELMLRDWVARGFLDPHPSAVDYALSVGGQLIRVGPTGDAPEPRLEKRTRKAVTA